MERRVDQICAGPDSRSVVNSRTLATGIHPASVYCCDDPDQAERLLAGDESGYVYQRDGHPNADAFAQKCRELHAADWAVVTSCGMSALALATLTNLQAGQHVLISDQLYGRSTQLLVEQWKRLGVEATEVNTLDLRSVATALRPTTSWVIVETITNPMLRLTDVPGLAELAHGHGAKLLVDNTFATPWLTRPLDLGADLVMESISKMMNGHSDVMLGLLVGRGDDLAAYRNTLSVWGLTSSPFDCWLARRGLATFHLRMERASQNARQVAEALERHAAVDRVLYPGLRSHPDHGRLSTLANVWPGLGEQTPGGSMVTFDLRGGREGVKRLIEASSEIPFCPSLGEVSTTLSHPASTSHRRLSEAARHQLGIQSGTVRLSVGTEDPHWVVATLSGALDRSLEADIV